MTSLQLPTKANTHTATKQCPIGEKQNRIGIRFGILLLCLGLAVGSASAQQLSAKPDWSSLRFLIGEWIGEGSGEPGKGTGGFDFVFDLDEQIIVRHNRSDYPATKDRPAFSHNDLLIIYPGNQMQAMYFDNEGHVINYNCQLSSDGDTVTFVSAVQPKTPRFRLSYVKKAADTLLIIFEFAPPSNPDEFVQYLSGLAYRVKSDPALRSGEKRK